MSLVSRTPETDLSHTADPQWELVERIVASPSFAKSDRLRRFLLYICELSLQGRADEINELNIGEKLFGRARNYDSSVDGIVRSHASRLRHRLEQYFGAEGKNEPIRLFIPRGAYLPVFEPQPEAPAPEIAAAETLDAKSSETLAKPMEAIRPAGERPSPWMLLSFALALACAAMVSLLVYGHTRAAAPVKSIGSHLLWGYFFGTNQSTVVVCSDSGLTALQQITGHSMKLTAYLDTDERRRVVASPGMAAEALQDVVERRYTSIVNLLIVTRLFRLAGNSAHQIDVRYARDVRPDDLKDHPVILLGSNQTDPWVEMFDGGMNFTIEDDMKRGISTVFNRSPRANELARYDSVESDPRQTVYAVVALRSNPGGARRVLMLEGTSMAATEAAADFVFEDQRLLPFLNQIRRRDGFIPNFEVLLTSNNVDGYAPQSRIVAYRTSQD